MAIINEHQHSFVLVYICCYGRLALSHLLVLFLAILLTCRVVLLLIVLTLLDLFVVLVVGVVLLVRSTIVLLLERSLFTLRQHLRQVLSRLFQFLVVLLFHERLILLYESRLRANFVFSSLLLLLLLNSSCCLRDLHLGWLFSSAVCCVCFFLWWNHRLFFAESLREFWKLNYILFVFFFLILFFGRFNRELGFNQYESGVINLMNFLIVTILNQCTDVLCSTGNLKYLFLFKHSFIQLKRFEFVLVIAVTQYIVLTHAPWVHLIFVRNNSISVVASWFDKRDFLLLVIILNVFIESEVPKEFISSWPSEVTNGAEIFLFSILGLFDGLAAL